MKIEAGRRAAEPTRFEQCVRERRRRTSSRNVTRGRRLSVSVTPLCPLLPPSASGIIVQPGEGGQVLTFKRFSAMLLRARQFSCYLWLVVYERNFTAPANCPLIGTWKEGEIVRFMRKGGTMPADAGSHHGCSRGSPCSSLPLNNYLLPAEININLGI